MSNDPLDAVFVTGDEAAELKRTDTARKLATYLERMPAELRGMFTDQFKHISIAELDQLRARLDELESDHSLLTKRLEAVIDDRDDYALQLTQRKIECVRANERIAEQARQIAEARKVIQDVSFGSWSTNYGEILYMRRHLRDECDAWLAANPAPEAEAQPPNEEGRP